MPKKTDPPQKSENLVDRTLAWSKNNKFVAALILFSIVISATARLADSVENLFTKGSELVSHANQKRSSQTQTADTSNASIGQVLLTFGDTGIGPGLFTDARGITVGPHGDIYVAEYLGGGRVQRFDSAGHFLNEWKPVTSKQPIFDIAANRQGDVYVAGDSLFKYNGDSGKRIGVLRYIVGFAPSPRDVQISPNDAVVTAWSADSDDVVVFGADGRIQRRIGAAVSSHFDGEGSEQAEHVIVDGAGSIYAFGHYGSTIYKFSADGKYLSRFGGNGTKPGQFHALLAAAVDGHGRIYAGDMLSLQVFDSDGRFLRRIENQGSIMGMTFDGAGALYTVANNKVTKYKISN